LLVFLRLPLDTRLRCAEVCRSWRQAASTPLLWARLDLSSVVKSASDGLLRAAAARAAGQLRSLDVSGCAAVTHAALLDAVAAQHAGSLRTLRCARGAAGVGYASPADVQRLLAAAPALRELTADVACGARDAHALLAGVAPFGPVRVRHLIVRFRSRRRLRKDGTDDDGRDGKDAVADALTLAADVAAHAWLVKLAVARAPLRCPALLGAFVDAALSRQLSVLCFGDCGLTVASAPALARLLRDGHALTALTVHGDGAAPLLDARGGAAVAAALRANATLVALSLAGVRLFDGRAAAAAPLLAAAAAHPTLARLCLHGNPVAPTAAAQAAAGAALACLLHAPPHDDDASRSGSQLRELDVADCGLDDVAMAPLMRALHGNAHLEALDCGGCALSVGFAHAVLLPAVRGTAALRRVALEHGVHIALPRRKQQQQQREEDAA
jgi:hypothetical protein